MGAYSVCCRFSWVVAVARHSVFHTGLCLQGVWFLVSRFDAAFGQCNGETEGNANGCTAEIRLVSNDTFVSA